MKVKFDQLKISTEYENQLINLDEMINKIISNYDCIDGVVNLFVPGSTGGITTIEYESGLIKDLPNILDKIIPPDGSDYKYFHNVYNGDDNGHSHVRASIIGLTGTWQNVVFIEFDRHAPRQRTIQVTIMGN
ncbi:MAG: YjbQ family protein [Candidatus Hodarchaeales archaeon]|jgi:secondary thiamine-phosphate synthase enzyme